MLWKTDVMSDAGPASGIDRQIAPDAAVRNYMTKRAWIGSGIISVRTESVSKARRVERLTEIENLKIGN
jgi:hypothetical protein